MDVTLDVRVGRHELLANPVIFSGNTLDLRDGAAVAAGVISALLSARFFSRVNDAQGSANSAVGVAESASSAVKSANATTERAEVSAVALRRSMTKVRTLFRQARLHLPVGSSVPLMEKRFRET